MSEERPAYLTTEEAAEALGLSRAQVWRRVRDEQLPALRLGDVLRVEAQAVRADAPDPIPAGEELTSPELAAHWRVSPRTVLRLINGGRLPAEARGRSYVVGRRSLVRFVVDHSRGDEVLVEDPALTWVRDRLPEGWVVERNRHQKIQARRVYRPHNGGGAVFTHEDPEVVVRLVRQLEQQLGGGDR